MSRSAIAASARGEIGTPLWPSWARRAIAGLEDLPAAPLAASADADALAEIAAVVANSAFALEGVRGDLVRSGYVPGRHKARVEAQPKNTRNKGDFTAAVFLDVLGRPADTAGWQGRMHRVFHVRNEFAGHPETRMGPVSLARSWLTARAAADAVALLRECLSALHVTDRVYVPDDLRCRV